MDLAFSLNNVSVAYATSEGIKPVLRDLDLQIVSGEWIALIGNNGSGKSTLAQVLAGLCPISRGTLNRAAAQANRHAVQMIFQNPDAQIVGATVYEDICFGLENRAVPPHAIPALAQAALAKVGLEQALHRPVAHLSGGQKQLLCIAAALAMDAAALIFDETTSMLDPLARQRVIHTAQTLHQQGTTIIWVTQLMEELGFAQRVVALDAGRIVFDGDPTRFLYGAVGNQPPCTALGFVPPYTVQAAQHLLQAGVDLPAYPLLPTQLSAMVRDLCQSVSNA